MLAHRAVSTCIEVVAQWVGPPVQLWSSIGGEDFTKANDVEHQVIETRVDDWLQIERESLRQALGRLPQDGPEMPAQLEESDAAGEPRGD